MNQKASPSPLAFIATLVTGLLMFSLGVQAHPYASGVTNDNGILYLWIVLGVLTDAVFLPWSRWRLVRDLRAIGTQRYEPRRSLFTRWRSRPPAKPPGPMASVA